MVIKLRYKAKELYYEGIVLVTGTDKLAEDFFLLLSFFIKCLAITLIYTFQPRKTYLLLLLGPHYNITLNQSLNSSIYLLPKTLILGYTTPTWIVFLYLRTSQPSWNLVSYETTNASKYNTNLSPILSQWRKWGITQVPSWKLGQKIYKSKPISSIITYTFYTKT